MKPAAAIFKFHIRVGVRLALSLLAPVLAGLFAFSYLFRPEFLVLLARQAFGQSAALAQGAVVATALFLSARMAATRISLGLGGWLRHLPASGRAERRSATAAVLVALTPILVVLAALDVVGALGASKPIGLDLAGLGVAALAAAMTFVPSEPRLARAVCGLPAAVLAGSGRPALVIAAAFLILLLDAWSGGVDSPSGRLRPRKSVPAAFFWTALNLRALGWTVCLGPAAAAVPAVLTRFFLRNNDLPAAVVPVAVRLGSAMSLVAALSVSAGILARRRPPWPWSRSLGRSSRRSVLSDAAFLAAVAAISVPLFIPLHPWAALSGLAFLVPGSLRAVGSIRSGRESPLGVGSAFAAEGAVAAVFFGVWAWAPIALLALSPLALALAASDERGLKVTRWSAHPHAARGDPMSWSER